MVARFLVVGFLVGLVGALDQICERIDFNDFTRSRITECSGTRKEIFRLATYASSSLFKPYRENVQYYLANDVLGISCSETSEIFYMHEPTEIRMIYQLLYRTTSTLTLRILDMDQLENGQPKVVQRWSSENQTNTWSLFVGKIQQEIKRAKLQIEVDITVGASIAIEYITIFNSAVQEQFCKDLDEFYTSTEATTVTVPTTRTTTTIRTTTTATTTTSTTTTTRPTTTTTRTTTTPTTTSTTTTPRTTTASTSTTASPTTTTRTTTPSTTTSPEIRTTSIETTTSEPTSTTTELPTSTPALNTDPPASLPATRPQSGAVWIALTGVFITLSIMASATALYIHCNTRQLSRSLAEQFGVQRTAPPKNTNHHANNHLHLPPLDHTIHRKLQQQLKNRLQQQHSRVEAEMEMFDAPPPVLHSPSSKYPPRNSTVVDVNLNRPVDAGKGEFRDDISEIKFKNRNGKY